MSIPMSIRRLSRLIITAVLATFVVSWFSPSKHPAAVGMAPAISPVAVIATADGTSLFNIHCAFCHGKDGAGLPNWRAKGQPDFRKPEWQSAHTDAQISEAIKNGEGKTMPAFKTKLSEADVAALVSRIREFGNSKNKK